MTVKLTLRFPAVESAVVLPEINSMDWSICSAEEIVRKIEEEVITKEEDLCMIYKNRFLNGLSRWHLNRWKNLL
jgi:hypothetical protein